MLEPEPDQSQVLEVVAGLRTEQSAWTALQPRERGAFVAHYIEWLTANRRRFEDALIAETGKSASDAAMEIPMAAQVAAYYATHAERFLACEQRSSPNWLLANKRATMQYRPRGVVGVISPWNYPIANCLTDAIPALLAGCAVLVKPSERAPSTVDTVLDGWNQVGAPKVLARLHGGRAIAEAVVDHVDFVQFTGSSATGRAVAARAAQRLTPVSLELGGKDPMLVLIGADIRRAARGAVWGSMFNAGQTCVSVERVYVVEEVYEQFVAEVLHEVSRLKVGVGAGFDVGALVDSGQLEIVDRHVRDAVTNGATVHTGGKLVGDGLLYPPTVLTNVTSSMLCMSEETFGPLLPIVAVADDAEAIALANASPYGLSATVWSGDSATAQRVAAQLDVGTVNINDVIVNIMEMSVPHGGWKDSGIGARMGGADGIRKYCRTAVVVEHTRGLRSEPNWYSAPPLQQRLVAKLLLRNARGQLRKVGR